MDEQAILSLLEQWGKLRNFTVTRDAALEGRSGTPYDVPLLFEHEEGVAAVYVHDAEGWDYEHVVDDIGAQALVVFDPERRVTPAPRIWVWGREELSTALGDDFVAMAMGEDPQDWPFREGKQIVPRPRAEPTLESELSIDDAMELLPGMDLIGDVDDLLAPEMDMDLSTLSEVKDDEQAEGSIQRMTVLRGDARNMVASELPDLISQKLVLRPEWVLEYRCHLLVEGSLDSQSVTGHLAIDARNKTVRTLTELPATTNALDEEFERLQIREVGATPKEAAQDAIQRIHTRKAKVEVHDPEEDLIYTELRPVKPDPRDLTIGEPTLMYRPLWMLEGQAGRITLDATTGEVLDGSLRSRSTDSIEL